MERYSNRIITASAGTGKTYRLSVEFISILLTYFVDYPEFRIDNILVLTFTRKATAEIRERIFQTLMTLLSSDDKQAEERIGLIKALNKCNSALKLNPEALDERSYNKLLSAYKLISADKQLLKVMTIDSYIGAIFRNLVRPLRSIDSFEIDTDAARKRISQILASLMTDRLKHKVDKLLRRKINPSLDEYSAFFISLIERRWYYYLINKRFAPEPGKGLQAYLHEAVDNAGAPEAICRMFEEMVSLVRELWLVKRDEWADYFVKDFRLSFTTFPATPEELLMEFGILLQDPRRALDLLKVIKTKELKGIFNGVKLGRKEPERKEKLFELQVALHGALADYLLKVQLKPEQDEILEVWGEVLAEYDRLLYQNRVMSYDDIAWFCFEALYSISHDKPDPEASSFETEFYEFLSFRSRFILIDEFQDTSLIQFNILRPIIEEICAGEGERSYGGMVVVGDEKQSIFGWRGGERELLLKLGGIFRSLGEPLYEKLNESWRSSPHLMSFINHIFSDASIHQRLADQGMKWEYSPVTSRKPKLDQSSRIELINRPYQKKGTGEVSKDDIYEDFIKSLVLPALDMYPKEDMAILCRKTEDLSKMQLILEKLGVTSVFEPSASLLDHALVSSLLDWLRYLAYGDSFSLLAVLRSDYYLLQAEPLKVVIDYLGQLQKDPAKTADAPDYLQQLIDLAQKAVRLVPSEACELFVHQFLDPLAVSERDNLNLYAFISLLREYELSESQMRLGIPELLKYLEENRNQEFLRQRSLTEGGGLQLLTIHKSKGLQFSRVFVFYNLTGTHGREDAKLKYYFNYAGDSFHEISDFGLTLHYDKVLKSSRFAGLTEGVKKRELLEEMNTLYVAFTRAKAGLGIYFSFISGEDWESYSEAKDEEAKSLPLLLAQSAANFLKDRGATGENGYLELTSPVYKEPKQSTQTEAAREEIVLYPELGNSEHLYQDYPRREGLDYRKVWLEDRAGLKGDLVHFYLSGLLRNSPTERELSRSHCLRRYGSILSASAIYSILDSVDAKLPAHAEIFAPAWDKVFTEKRIWHRNRELRIDRLMVNTDQRLVRIIDFKTGGISDEDQVETYVEALQELAWVKRLGYTVSGDYIFL